MPRDAEEPRDAGEATASPPAAAERREPGRTDRPPSGPSERHQVAPTTVHAAVERLGRVVTVWAHPDDEAYLAGGLLAAASDNGQPITVVTATLGEGGTDDAAAWPAERLGRVRGWECRAAMAVLGVGDHRWLGLADGACASAGAFAVEALAEVLDDTRPDTVVTFGPDGMTGHPDHRAVSRWVGEACRRARPRPRLLHAALEAGFAARVADIDRRLGVVVDGEGAAGLARSALALHLRLEGPLLDRKVVALRAQASQTAGAVATLGEERFARWVAEEAFVEAATEDDAAGG
jgi:LmbE family N-acetylglucosaminyl deacetylase